MSTALSLEESNHQLAPKGCWAVPLSTALRSTPWYVQAALQKGLRISVSPDTPWGMGKHKTHDL